MGQGGGTPSRQQAAAAHHIRSLPGSDSWATTERVSDQIHFFLFFERLQEHCNFIFLFKKRSNRSLAVRILHKLLRTQTQNRKVRNHKKEREKSELHSRNIVEVQFSILNYKTR